MWMTALLLPVTGLFFLFTLRVAVIALFDSQLSHNCLPGSHLFCLILLAACISVLLVLLGFSLDRSSTVDITQQVAPRRPVNLHICASWYVKLLFYILRLLASVYPFWVLTHMQVPNLLVFAFPEVRHQWFSQGIFVLTLIAFAIISAEVAVIVCYLQLRHQDHNW